MHQHAYHGYVRGDGFALVTLAYETALQYVIVLPDAPDGLRAVERSLTPAALAGAAQLESVDMILHLPKFKLELPTLALAKLLGQLGIRTAFGSSANYDRMAAHKPDEYITLSEVFHKTWPALDEQGTEAAAATVVAMALSAPPPRKMPEPVEIRVDRPFLFAIQHVPSATCLFLGRVTDPR